MLNDLLTVTLLLRSGPQILIFFFFFRLYSMVFFPNQGFSLHPQQ